MISTLSSISQLQNYAGAVRTIFVVNEGLFNYTLSALTPDDETIYSATGIGSGFWVRQQNAVLIVPEGDEEVIAIKGRVQVNSETGQLEYHNGINWSTIKEQFVNVKDFGAKGDGVTDDTDAILAACAAPNASIVYFPKGTYINKNLLYRDEQTYLGQVRDSTIIKWKDSVIVGETSDNLISRFVKGQARVNSTFRGLTFDGNKDNMIRQTLAVMISDNITFEDCNFINAPETTLKYTGGGVFKISGCKFLNGSAQGPETGQTASYIYVQKSLVPTQNVITIIENCTFEGVEDAPAGQGSGGIFASGNDGAETPMVIRNNIFRNVGSFNDTNFKGSIYLYVGCNNSIIENNRIYDRPYTGISVQNSHNVAISNNYVDGVNTEGHDWLISNGYGTPAAISCNMGTNGNTENASNLKIVGNHVINSQGTDAFSIKGNITVGELNGAVIRDNYVDGADTGIFLARFKSATIENNILLNCGVASTTNYPIKIEEGLTSSDVTVAYNDIRSTPSSYGIRADQSLTNTSLRFTGNTINGAAIAGIRVIGFSSAFLTNNRVINSPSAYQVQTGTYAALTGNYTDLTTVSTGSAVTTYREVNNSWNQNILNSYVGTLSTSTGYSELFTGDMNAMNVGNYVQAVSNSATNRPITIGTIRSFLRFGARNSSDNALSSDLVIGTSGMAFRNNTNTSWSTVATQAYADAKVQNSLTASTTVAPSTTAVNGALDLKANKAGDTYTGTHNFTGATITAQTATAGTNTTQVATTEFIQAEFSARVIVNTTTVALGSSDLNTTYPNVPKGTQVICKDIIAGGLIYTKVTEAGSSDVWVSTSCTVVV